MGPGGWAQTSGTCAVRQRRRQQWTHLDDEQILPVLCQFSMELVTVINEADTVVHPLTLFQSPLQGLLRCLIPSYSRNQGSPQNAIPGMECLQPESSSGIKALHPCATTVAEVAPQSER